MPDPKGRVGGREQRGKVKARWKVKTRLKRKMF